MKNQNIRSKCFLLHKVPLLKKAVELLFTEFSSKLFFFKNIIPFVDYNFPNKETLNPYSGKFYSLIFTNEFGYQPSVFWQRNSNHPCLSHF